jgi:signal transduction histidine kinase
MKKNMVIILIVVQLLMLFLFQNLYFLFKELEGIDVQDLQSKTDLEDNIRQMKKVFSFLSILVGIFLMASGIYLAIVYKKSKSVVKLKNISPLQDYLLELRDSEIELKGMVEKQQEHAIWKEELNRSIIDNINSAIVFLNQFMKIDIINSRPEKIFGQSYAHAKNNTMETILGIFPELVTFIDSNKDKKVSSEICSREKIFWVDLIPIQRMGLLVIIKDITEDKQREEIERKNKNFIMLGEMTASLTHEVRNSLGVIYGYVKSIKSEIIQLKKGAMSNKVDRITKEIEFLSATMESFLNFSKPILVEKKEKIDLILLLKKIANEKNIKIVFSQTEIFLYSDPILIAAVFSNLILNAREAHATRVEIDFKLNHHLEVYLRDNGRGIDTKIIKKIWLPLFTTKEKGTGMGLAIVRKMVNTLKGEIQLMESSSAGSVFRIIFY